MKKASLIFLLLVSTHCFAQVDSTVKSSKKVPVADTQGRPNNAIRLINDTARPKVLDTLVVTMADSALVKNAAQTAVAKPLSWADDTAFARLLTFKHIEDKPGPVNQGQARVPQGREQVFYILAALVLFLGAVKAAYPKYFQDTFRLFIQISQKQRQTPEQLVQGYVPGFLFNLLFLMVGGMLITLYGIKIKYLSGPLWLLALYCAGLLAGIYLLKYAVTALAGWLFSVKEAAGMYSFIVFLINRVIGILLLPVLILIAFYDGDANTVLFTIAVCFVFFLLIYRYALSLTVIRKNLKVSALHFFIYLCAVELMPLLVIYKELFNQVHSK